MLLQSLFFVFVTFFSITQTKYYAFKKYHQGHSLSKAMLMILLPAVRVDKRKHAIASYVEG